MHKTHKQLEWSELTIWHTKHAEKYIVDGCTKHVHCTKKHTGGTDCSDSLHMVSCLHKVHTGGSNLLCFWDSYLHSSRYRLDHTSLRSTVSQEGHSTLCHEHIHCSESLVALSPRVSHHMCVCSLLGVCSVAFASQVSFRGEYSRRHISHSSHWTMRRQNPRRIVDMTSSALTTRISTVA